MINLNLNCTKVQGNYRTFKKISQNAQTPSFKGGQNKVPLLAHKNISFGALQKDPLSYTNCLRKMRELEITTKEDIEASIKEENLIGTGANSKVYQFDAPELSDWVIKVDKKPFKKPYETFTPIRDEFYPQNLGQEILRIGDRYRILKRIKGEPHSVKDWSYHINNNGKVSKKEALRFSENLQKIANFSQSSFDDYAKQIASLEKAGYKQDSINPNNLLIDYADEKINVIDFFKAVNPAHTNSRLDLSMVLLDFSLFPNFYEKLDGEEKEDLVQASADIIEKCDIASRKYGLVQDEKTYLDYLANVDKYFGFALVDKGGDYISRYERTKEILCDCLG